VGERYADACFSLSAFRRDGACQAAIVAANFLKREVDNPEVRGIAFAEVSDEKNLNGGSQTFAKVAGGGTANQSAQRTFIEPAWKSPNKLVYSIDCQPNTSILCGDDRCVVSKTIRLLGTNDPAKGFDVTM
jgi:hypothetical protein